MRRHLSSVARRDGESCTPSWAGTASLRRRFMCKRACSPPMHAPRPIPTHAPASLHPGKAEQPLRAPHLQRCRGVDARAGRSLARWMGRRRPPSIRLFVVRVALQVFPRCGSHTCRRSPVLSVASGRSAPCYQMDMAQGAEAQRACGGSNLLERALPLLSPPFPSPRMCCLSHAATPPSTSAPL